MVFGLFSRKSTLDDTSPEQNTNRLLNHSPLRFSTTVLGGSNTDLTSDPATDSVAEGGSHVHSPAPPPPDTPTPPPVGPNDTKALYDLMFTIPPKTLHAYTLAHLHPNPPSPSTSTSPALASHPPRPPSPNTVAKLSTFFSALAPPPLLHCVRCHKEFFDIENEEKDKACRVAHDDESALVSRVSGGGGGYETLWGCCGQTASGDGSEGPPDGWCYEGRHTIDIKRARFRADSTLHDDKLTSCLKLNCRGIHDQLPRPNRPSPTRKAGTPSARRSNPSPVRSLASRSTRKRARKSLKDASGSEDEADAESTTSRAAKAKPKEKASDDAGERDKDKDTRMAVDEPTPPPKPRTKAKSQPISRARLPASTSTITTIPSSGTTTSPAGSKTRSMTTKPKSTSHTLLSQSHSYLASDSEASTQSRPRTRSLVREESRSRATSKIKKGGISERTRRARKAIQALSQSEEELETATGDFRESDQEERGRDRKKRRVARG